MIYNCQFIFISYLCRVKNKGIIPFFLLILLLVGCRQAEVTDPLRRSHVDGLNKEAFICRYLAPDSCIALSEKALQYIDDSLPTYSDGALRALNNMAFAYYQMSDHENAWRLIEQVENRVQGSPQLTENGNIEQVIAHLLEARLLQRSGRIADSYRLLYDIERSHVLQHSHDNILYSFAQSEFYITMLVLNYHYRDGHEADVRLLLSEVEQHRPQLKVDYAQDMALNYALAYGWQSAGESDRALDYCARNHRIMEIQPKAFCRFQYANTLQMTASALKSQPGRVSPDSVLALYDQARRLFFDYGDPYQMLGGTISTARYALLIGDTAVAHRVLAEWRSLRGTWKPFAAPKMEMGYFDVLLRSRMASSPDENLRWYEHYAELQERIKQNEREDFTLQQTLADATRRSRWMTRTTMLVSALLAIVLAMTVLLWISASRLRREKRQLEEAKRRDVERIANVETCLSVMRHDVSPFIGYLRNPNLSPELRDEILGQLLRTFDNIKNWTHLSIPSGLTFNASRFPLQQVFDAVRVQVIRPHADVELRIEPTACRVWGDPLLLTILLRNLTVNALQHTTEGHVTLTALPAEDGMVDIAVSDTGSGMTAEQQESLFRADRPMATVADGSEHLAGDHGFGLILCRYIIKKHDDLTRRGCKLWVESDLGVGTTMRCRVASADNA